MSARSMLQPATRPKRLTSATEPRRSSFSQLMRQTLPSWPHSVRLGPITCPVASADAVDPFATPSAAPSSPAPGPGGRSQTLMVRSSLPVAIRLPSAEKARQNTPPWKLR